MGKRLGQVAEQLKLTASDCLQLGVVDVIIPEPPGGAHMDPPLAMQILHHHVLHAITKLDQVPVKQLLARRYRKFRRHGRFQQRQHLLTNTSVTVVEQTQSLLHQLKHRLTIAVIARLLAIVSQHEGCENGLAS